MTGIRRRLAALAAASRPAARARRSGQQGQALVLMTGILIMMIALATLLIDGSFMYEAQTDLDVVATHAAKAAAAELDTAGMAAACTAWVTAQPAAQKAAAALSCPARFLFVNAPTARARAAAVGNQWIAASSGQALSLPGFTPATGSVNTVILDSIAAGTRVTTSVTVTAQRCYKPFLLNIFAGNGGACPNGMLVSRTVTVRPQNGN